jgi:DNA topoisomerase I
MCPAHMTDVAVPGLRYVSDDTPGIRRRRAGKGFTYTHPDGSRVTDKDDLARIRKLAIPPAWTDVWICPAPNGHIQATGRDAKRRKQYRYHEKWRMVRDESKFERTVAFAENLPALRRRVRKDMADTGLGKATVVATVVALLDCCFARIGNECYTRENGSFGLTTLRDRHAKFDGSKLRLRYKGKAGKEHDAFVDDRRIVHIVKKCQDVPGQTLFQYFEEDGSHSPVDSSDVNDYLREITGTEFSAKDFRTWSATVIAARELREAPLEETEKAKNAIVVEAVDIVASELGNTRAVCRASYIHPDVIAGYMDGSLHDYSEAHRSTPDARGLRSDERFTLGYLKSRTRRRTKRAA